MTYCYHVFHSKCFDAWIKKNTVLLLINFYNRVALFADHLRIKEVLRYNFKLLFLKTQKTIQKLHLKSNQYLEHMEKHQY